MKYISSDQPIIKNQLGMAMIGAALGYILAAVFIHFFINYYLETGYQTTAFFENGRWGEVAYDSFPLKLFYGIVFILGPIFSFIFVQNYKSTHHIFSVFHFLGFIIATVFITGGMSNIFGGGDDTSGITIIVLSAGFLLYVMPLTLGKFIRETLGEIIHKIRTIPLRYIWISYCVSGLLTFTTPLISYYIGDRSSSEGIKIGIVIVCMLIGASTASIGCVNYRCRQNKVLLESDQRISDRRPSKNVPIFLGDILVWLLLGAFIFPSSLLEITSNIFPDHHVVSYLLGPAINYAYGDRLIPGIDYFSQYSLAIGPIFSPFLSISVFDTYANYAFLAVVLVIVFYGMLYHVLTDFFASRIWSFFVTFMIMIMGFASEAWLSAPSQTPLRYFLLPLFAWLLVGVIEDDVLLDKRKFIRLNGVGLVVGISIFLNTETGIYMIVAVAGSFFVFHALNKKFWLKGFVVGSSALLMFLVLSFAFYGRGIFTSRFVVGILEVLFAFGSGFGDIPMVWGELQSVLYNTLTPMVSLASLGWIFATRTQRDSSISMQQKGYLAIFSILSILFLIKYINRAFQQNWLVASINTLIVISWWLYFFMKGLFVEFRDARNELVETSQLGSAYYIMALLLLYSCLLFFSYASVNIGDVLVINVAADGEEFPVIEEAPIGVRAFGYWPSLVRSVFLESNILEQNVAQMRYQVEPAQVDIDLIEGLLEPRERVSVFAENDFAYYLALRRASQFGYIPSKETVFDYYTDIWLNEQARLVFVESVPKRIAPEIHWTLKTNYLGYRPDIGGRIKVYARIEPGNEIIYTPLDQEMSNSLDGLLSRGDIMCENRLIYPSGVMNDSPVLDLPSGDYQINFWLSIADNKSNGGVVMIAITSEMGDLIKPREIFAHEFLESGQFQLFSVHLDLLDRMNGIEFIVEPMGKTKIFLEKIIIVRNDR